MTDRTKIKRAFKELRKSGYICKSNFLCCRNCAWSHLDQEHPEADKIVFYHNQDNDNIKGGNIDSYGLHLAWVGNGYEICYHLMKQGLNVEWDGTGGQRIKVLHSPDEK